MACTPAMTMARSTTIGTYRSMTRRPSSEGSAVRNVGIRPRIASSTEGKATIQKRLPGSRLKSLTSDFSTAVDAVMSGLLLGEIRGAVRRHIGRVAGRVVRRQVEE